LLDEVTSLRARLSELEKCELGPPGAGEQAPEARGNGADGKKGIA
jgi:hypothetical protein